MSRSGLLPTGVRARLVVLAALPLTVALVLVAVAVALVFSAGLVRDLDAQTRQEMAVLHALVAGDGVPEVLPLPAASPLLTQVLREDGSVLASSPSASRLQALPDALSTGVLTDEEGGYAGAPLRLRVDPATLAGQPVRLVVAAPLADVRRVVSALRLVLLLVVPVLVAGGTALTWAVAGRALRPVEQLRQAAADLAGRPGAPVALPGTDGDDEVARLAATLQELVGGLHRLVEQQRALVADAAHELRSPLAGLAVQLDVARAHPDGVSVPELVADLAPDVARLERLVGDLLALARLEGPAAPPRELLDLRELAGAGGDPAPVLGDRAALLRLVANLRENAERVATTVVLTTRTEGDLVLLDVDDDGPGIPEPDRARVLDRFVRLDASRSRPGGGAGLGLAIVRATARAHGGDVEVLAAPLGGARLRVRLPRAAVHSPDAGPRSRAGGVSGCAPGKARPGARAQPGRPGRRTEDGTPR